MAKRSIGPFSVEPVGLGAMPLSHGYPPRPTPEEGARLLHHALDIGMDLVDTAALYGFGANETLIGAALADRRDAYVLTSKGALFGRDGKRMLDARPETLAANLEDSLRRLGTDRIDLYYLHRVDPAVPVEESVGAIARMVEAGKVRAIGLSEVSGPTIERAHAVHPIAAVQNEYSPWSREAEISAIDACAKIGAAFVAFSPVARGFLAGAVRARAQLQPGDLRLAMPRFNEPNFAANLACLAEYEAIARDVGITPAQLAIAWGLARAPHLVSIPGTTNIAHLEENFAARTIALDAATIARVDATVNRATIHGERYPPTNQAEIDTETFA